MARMPGLPCGQVRRSIRRVLPWQTATVRQGMKWPRRSIRVVLKIGRRCRVDGDRKGEEHYPLISTDDTDLERRVLCRRFAQMIADKKIGLRMNAKNTN